MDERKDRWLEPELANELAQTAQTLARLGATLATLPMVFLPSNKRRQARQLSSELIQIGVAVPRTLGVMRELAEERQTQRRYREDLGTRIRREQRAGQGATRQSTDHDP